MVPNVGLYLQNVNALTNLVQEVGNSLNDDFELVSDALAKDHNVESIDAEKLAAVKENFDKGCKEYHLMAEQFGKVRPPAKIIFVHKALAKSFLHFVAACDEMKDSIDLEKHAIAEDTFRASEEKQTGYSADMSKHIQKITKMLF